MQLSRTMHIYCAFQFLTLCLVLSPHAWAEDSTIDSLDIKFQSNGTELAGTIMLPSHPVASIVLVDGSDRVTRSLGLAKNLAAQGFAIFVYDKRGVGQSGGIYVGPEVGTNNVDHDNLGLLAEDASAAVNALIERLPHDHGPVGLMGASQAGWVIPLAARMNRSVQFMALFSGPLVTPREQLRYQFYTQGHADFWSTHTEDEVRYHIRADADRFPFVDTDPLESLRDLQIPGLWLFGGRDVSIPPNLSIERLQTLIAQGKPYSYRLLADANHFLYDRPEAFMAAVEWIKSLSGSK